MLGSTVSAAGVYEHCRSKILIHFRHRSCRRRASPIPSDIIWKRYGTQGRFFFFQNPPLGPHRKASSLRFAMRVTSFTDLLIQDVLWKKESPFWAVFYVSRVFNKSAYEHIHTTHVHLVVYVANLMVLLKFFNPTQNFSQQWPAPNKTLI